jgi:hypothetical protein
MRRKTPQTWGSARIVFLFGVDNPLLRFEPIYQYRLWGGRRLATLLSAPLPGDDPIGEAWLLSGTR